MAQRKYEKNTMLERRNDKFHSMAYLVYTTMTTTTTILANSFLAPVTHKHSQIFVIETISHSHRRKHLHTHTQCHTHTTRSSAESFFSLLFWSMKFKLNETVWVPRIFTSVCVCVRVCDVALFSLTYNAFLSSQLEDFFHCVHFRLVVFHDIIIILLKQ